MGGAFHPDIPNPPDQKQFFAGGLEADAENQRSPGRGSMNESQDKRIELTIYIYIYYSAQTVFPFSFCES